MAVDSKQGRTIMSDAEHTDKDGGLPPTAAGQLDERPVQVPAGDGAPLDPAGEETLWVGRTHWQHHAVKVGAGLAILVVGLFCLGKIGGWADWGSSVSWLIGFLWALLLAVFFGGWVLFLILSCRYRLTGQRLFIERGILSQTIDQTELIRVDDVRLKKSLVDRVFGLGSVEVLSTDVSDKSIVIAGVKGAEEVAEHIRRRMRTLRSRSLFIENL